MQSSSVVVLSGRKLCTINIVHLLEYTIHD